MDRFLALAAEDRARAFEQAGRRGLSPGSVEKDFWVCLLLRELFTLPEAGEHLTFKGGTSLSKAWGLIDRFSEDIDLTIDRESLGLGGDRGPEAAKNEGDQRRRLKKVRMACRQLINRQLAPALSSRLTAKLPGESWNLASDEEDQDAQTLLFAYPGPASTTRTSYVRPVVKLEFGARSDPWPVAQRHVTSIVAEEFSSLFETPSCTVRALLPERTFWEKAMLLHEESFRPPDKARRPRMARHYYDVWRLIEGGVAARAAVDMDLFDQVAAHRRVFFRQTWMDYDTLKRGSIRMVPLPDQLGEWSRDYLAMQAEMFVDTPPAFELILTRITAFLSEFNGSTPLPRQVMNLPTEHRMPGQG